MLHGVIVLVGDGLSGQVGVGGASLCGVFVGGWVIGYMLRVMLIQNRRKDGKEFCFWLFLY